MSYFSRLFVPVLERYEQNDEDKKVDGGVSVASETDTTRDKRIKTEKDDKTSQVDVARVSPPTAAKSETDVTTSTATGARPFGTITTRGDASPQAAVTQLSIAAKDKAAGNGGALETLETPASPMDEASPAETHVKGMAVDENPAKDTPMDEAPVDEKLGDEARTDDNTRMAENPVEDTLRSPSVDALPEKEAMQVDNDNQSMGDALSVGDNDDDQPVTIDITADTDNDNDDYDVDYSLLDDDDGFAASMRDKMAQKRRAPVDDEEDVDDERVDGSPESSEPPKPPLPVKRGPGRPPKHKGPGRPRKYPKPEKIAKSKRAYTPRVTPNKQDDEIQKTPEKQGKKKEARANGFQPAFQQSLPQMFQPPFQAPFQQPYMSPFPMQQAMGSFVDPATGITYQPTIVYQPVYPPGAMQQPSMIQPMMPPPMMPPPMMPPPMMPMMMPPQQGTASSSSSSAAATSSSSSSSTSMVPAYWPQQQQQAQMMMMPWMSMPPYTTTPPQSSPNAPPTMTSTPTPAIQRVASPVPSTTSGESRESSVLSDPDGGDDDDNPEVHRGLRHRRIERRKLHLATRASLEDLDIDETTPLTNEDKLLIGLFNTATRRDLFALRPDNYVKDRGMHTLRSRRPLINKTDLVSFMNQDRVKWSNISVAYINVHKLITRLDKWVWPNVDRAGLELEHVLSSWRRQLERDDNKDDDDNDDNKDGDKDKAKDKQVPLLTSPPINMSPALDEYQLMGINWMDTLFAQKMAGVLVDQQDPAKRVAMMVAFLARQVQLQKHKAGVHLLIIGADDGPIEMWKRQFDAFKPLLTMKTYLGTNPERARTRPILASTPGIDVILTTATIGIESIPDRTFLSGLHIASLILDGCNVHGKTTTYPTTLFQYKRIQVRILLVSDEPTNIYTNYVLLSRFILPQQFYGHTQVMAIDFRPFFRTPQELAAIKNDPADNHMPPSDLTNTFDKIAAHFQTAVRRFALLHHTRHELAIAMTSTRSPPATST